jgi:hypothetical protein
MASDLGATPIVAEFPRSGYAYGVTRSIWVRFLPS